MRVKCNRFIRALVRSTLEEKQGLGRHLFEIMFFRVTLKDRNTSPVQQSARDWYRKLPRKRGSGELRNFVVGSILCLDCVRLKTSNTDLNTESPECIPRDTAGKTYDHIL